ncbi:hypothetical protein OS493_021471 [Desmophyllum pertusum]|uniref:Steroid 5-alpha reductase C-terminal domain-containing protein n=1 Tax=Desmophyllum pertusum TaxID=174260 RepID=A0A9X0CRZ6_9CNID|nr:hypothetical protein OS493_021471 [Desmophyllum pertusum]
MGNVLSSAPKRPLLTAAALDFGIQWALWAVASILQTEQLYGPLYDLAGSSTFIFLILQTLRWQKKVLNLRQLVQSGCVTLWGLRLGLFLLYRIIQVGRDRRFDKVRGNPRLFLIWWTVQGLWVWMTLLPTLILNTSAKDEKLTWKDYMGWSLWLIGFILEVVADHQKSQFRADPANKGKWIASGLWSLCQHPNYLGEIMLWSSLFLPASSVMSGHQYWSVISPMFVAYMLTRLSGIPILERQGLKRWGHLTEYHKYRGNTAVLIPHIW